MIGFYNYTVILTYLSLFSAVIGMGFSISGHPLLAIMCLLLCGFCDMFDGRVARTKKDRSEEEKSYGIQIDSLSDVIAFGVLPAAIVMSNCKYHWWAVVISALYVLAGMIRLAYFNVTEELRQKETSEARKAYAGLPITAAALIFPVFYCLTPLILRGGRTLFEILLCTVAFLTGLLFLLPIRVKKPDRRELLAILVFGLMLAGILVFFMIRFHGHGIQEA